MKRLIVATLMTAMAVTVTPAIAKDIRVGIKLGRTRKRA